MGNHSPTLYVFMCTMLPGGTSANLPGLLGATPVMQCTKLNLPQNTPRASSEIAPTNTGGAMARAIARKRGQRGDEKGRARSTRAAEAGTSASLASSATCNATPTGRADEIYRELYNSCKLCTLGIRQ